MAKATDAQIRNVTEALANGEALPEGIRLNFGDPEPIQKADAEAVGASTAKTDDGKK